MKWKELFDQWSMSYIKLNAGFAELEFCPKDPDRDAAWEMYVELLTRITTQPLDPEHGDEQTALESVYALFGLTRQTLKNRGRHCTEFAKIAIVVLNQVVRPFTAKWHRASLAGEFNQPKHREQFRKELTELQAKLSQYSRLLANLANVEDMTRIE
ncbi:hypothetical protein N9L06_05560 [Mariniblastus sp.]|nr:hypothetical protein [Mariniblastus sp.]